jgi:hypothetical protein
MGPLVGSLAEVAVVVYPACREVTGVGSSSAWSPAAAGKASFTSESRKSGEISHYATIRAGITITPAAIVMFLLFKRAIALKVKMDGESWYKACVQLT